MLFEDDIIYLLLKTLVTTLSGLGMLLTQCRSRYSLRRQLVIWGAYAVYVALSSYVLIQWLSWRGFIKIFLLSISLPAFVIAHFFNERLAPFQTVFNFATQVNIVGVLALTATLLNQVFGWGKWQDLLFRVVIGVSVILLEYRFVRRPFLRITDILRGSWLTLSLIPLGFFVLLLTIAIYPVHYTENPCGVVFYYLTTAVMALVYLIMYQSLAKSQLLLSTRIEKEHIEQQLASQKRFYEEKLSSEGEMRALYHDLEGQLDALSTLLATGQTQEAREYLSRLTEQSQKLHTDMFCDDLYVNAVLSAFSARFREEGIAFTCRAGIKGYALPSVEVCLILNNALDNALEASLRMPKNDRSVKVQAAVRQEQLLIRISNRFNGTLSEEDGLPVTTKEEAGHGYGLANIRAAAQKLKGEMVYRAEKDSFVLDVRIPLAEAKRSTQQGLDGSLDG